MKTIIAGTDFTPSSVNACRYAALLAERFNCKLTIFNLFLAPVLHTNSGLYAISYTAVRKTSQVKTESVIKKLSAEFPSLKINTLSTSGAFEKEFKDFLTHHQVMAVVMGLAAKTRLSRFIWGSHGVSIGGKINAPVIIVPDKYKDHRIETMILAVDNKEKLTAGSLNGIDKIAKNAQLHVRLLHVRTPDEVLLSPVNPITVKIGRSTRDLAVQNSASIETGIKKYCSSHEADLVAVISKKHSVFYNLFNESVTKRIAFASKVPVMAIHE